MNFEEMYNSLKRLHESTNKMFVGVEEDNKKLKAENTLLLIKLENCQKALDINKEIMRNALTEQNNIQNSYGNEIQLLKAKIKLNEG